MKITIFAFLVSVLVAAPFAALLTRKASPEAAKTKGIRKAKAYLDNPVLIEDYSEEFGLSIDEINTRIGNGELEAYSWYQQVYVNRKSDAS